MRDIDHENLLIGLGHMTIPVPEPYFDMMAIMHGIQWPFTALLESEEMQVDD